MAVSNLVSIEKRVSDMEKEIVTFQVMLKSIDKNVCKIADQMEKFLIDAEPLKMEVHDNTNAIARMSKVVESNQIGVEDLKDKYGSMKAYLAGAMAVFSAVIIIAQYLLDKFVF